MLLETHLLLLMVSQGSDDVAQTQQTLVDVDAFLKGLASATCLLDPLRSSEIDKVELGRHEAFLRQLLGWLTKSSTAFASPGLLWLGRCQLLISK